VGMCISKLVTHASPYANHTGNAHSISWRIIPFHHRSDDTNDNWQYWQDLPSERESPPTESTRV